MSARVLSLLLHDVYRRERSESGFAGAAADRYKLSVAQLDAQLSGLAAALDAPPVLVGAPEGEAPGGVPVAITVDDGGVSYYTTVAPRLESLGWRGHCLVTTGFIGRRGFLDAGQIRELHARGHCIGTHSVTHPQRFALCSTGQLLREWSDSRKALQDVLGADVTVGSVPGGSFSRRVAETAGAAGLRTLFTSEPQVRVGRVGSCAVLGRFTLRAGSRLDLAYDLALLRPLAQAREWAAWNAKKLLKGLAGGAYPQLALWVERLRGVAHSNLPTVTPHDAR